MEDYLGPAVGLAGPALAAVAAWGLLRSLGLIRRRPPQMGWHCTARGVGRDRSGRKIYEFRVSGRTDEVVRELARQHVIRRIEWNNRNHTKGGRS